MGNTASPPKKSAPIKAPPTTPAGLQAQVSAQATRAWEAHDVAASARHVQTTRIVSPAPVAPVAPVPVPAPLPVKAKVATVGPGTTRSANPTPFVPNQGRSAPASKVGIGAARPQSSMAKAIARAEAGQAHIEG